MQEPYRHAIRDGATDPTLSRFERRARLRHHGVAVAIVVATVVAASVLLGAEPLFSGCSAARRSIGE